MRPWWLPLDELQKTFPIVGPIVAAIAAYTIRSGTKSGGLQISLREDRCGGQPLFRPSPNSHSEGTEVAVINREL